MYVQVLTVVEHVMVVETPLRRGYTCVQNRWNGGLDTQYLLILCNLLQLAGARLSDC